MNSYQRLKQKLEAKIALLEKEKDILIKDPLSNEAINIKNKHLIFSCQPKEFPVIKTLYLGINKSDNNKEFEYIESTFKSF